MEQTWFIRPVDSYLDRFPLVDPRGRGDRGAQQPPFLHSGLGVLDPPKDLPKRMTLVNEINVCLQFQNHTQVLSAMLAEMQRETAL